MKVYGTSDAEKEFLSKIKGMFKVISFNSFEEFKEFEKSPYNFKESLISEKDKSIKKIEEDIQDIEKERNKTYEELKHYNFQISKKVQTIQKVYGELKEEIQDEIDSLKFKRDHLDEKVSNLNIKKRDYEQDLKKEKEERYALERDSERDIKKVKELVENNELKKLMQGTWGEKKVIEHLQESFKENNYHLINSFNLDIIKNAINFNNRGLTENKIDHILVCPKGFFIIETKAWKSITDIGKEKIKTQLEKTEHVFEEIFKDKIKEIEIILTSTEIPIEIEGFTCIRLDSLKKFISDKKDILTNDEITKTINLLIPHLEGDHMDPISKAGFKLKGLWVMGKEFIKKS